MTTNQSIPSTVKRVMSKDDHEEMRNEKKSKMGGSGEFDCLLFDVDAAAAAAVVKQLSLGDVDDTAAATAAAANRNNDSLIMKGDDMAPIPNVHVPVASISHTHESRASTTHSSLSDEDGDDRDIEDMHNLMMDMENVAPTDNINANVVTTEAKQATAAVAARAATGGMGMTRQISNDDSLHGKSASVLSSEDGGGNKGMNSPSVGNWGWFEDVHGHESSFLPDHGGLKGGNGIGSGMRDNSNSTNRGDKKKKKGGLLKIGSDLMQNALQAFIEPRRQEANTMAVTAPVYVLEESFSSQKLWKLTAGNRPPQPVEERAFFEQMWAQNFSRSKVKYEIPVEVLTASTPISISPFNEDGFGVAGPGANLSNYNLAAPFNMKSGDEYSAADPASIKAAQADVAEATLNQHLNSNGAVEMYFDPNRPKDYNLKTLGPHHHHHTLVNKKVQGAGEDNALTVLVTGDNVFGTTVSKSFPRQDDQGEHLDGIDTVSISIASYRVVESKKHGKYAQYLVIFCDGNFRNTIGVWKRYSDFSELSRNVTHGQSESCAAVVGGLNPLSVTDDHDVEILPNAITSWRLLKKRQRWYRCLDAGYLSLKVFLLERFLHDILFESSNPQILRDFVGVNSSEASKLNTKG